MSALRRTPIQRRMSTTRRKSTDRMAAARPILEERSGGNCEICGQVFPATDDGYDFHMHHRLMRSRGGGDEVSNLLAIHHDPCHSSVHSRVSRAEDAGWLLPSGSTPSWMPLLYVGLPALLTDVGEVLPLPDWDETADPDHLYDVWLDQGNGIA